MKRVIRYLRFSKTVDFLLVDQLDRFSRNAGEAINMVKELQIKYNIQVVSATEGILFDYNTPGSFFRIGLQFLLAEEDNINRSIKIKKGIYTAKAEEGRFIYKTAPFGYRKSGTGKEQYLIIERTEAEIVKFIYESYLHDMPLYRIKKEAYEMGFDRRSNVAVERILRNPVYSGLLHVNPFNEFPGGLFHGLHEPIIDKMTWKTVQSKINKPQKVRNILDEELPLRGILKCHCSHLLTGAPSRGKSGKYFYYYKCRFPQRNNISAIKAHHQLLSALGLMSLPEPIINEIIKNSRIRINKEIRSNSLKIITRQNQLQEIEKKLSAVEEKWIMNEINRSSYERWHSEYSNKITSLIKSIKKLEYQVGRITAIFDQKLDLLIDMEHIYDQVSLLQKRVLIKIIFDDNLYYEQGIYKTPTLMELLGRNSHLMKERGYLYHDKDE